VIQSKTSIQSKTFNEVFEFVVHTTNTMSVLLLCCAVMLACYIEPVVGEKSFLEKSSMIFAVAVLPSPTGLEVVAFDFDSDTMYKTVGPYDWADNPQSPTASAYSVTDNLMYFSRRASGMVDMGSQYSVNSSGVTVNHVD
jgi:hypothetical protein